MIKILSWNMAHRNVCWDYVFESDYDIALLQEAPKPKVIPDNVEINPGEWRMPLLKIKFKVYCFI
jgi:hypothetical protein